MHILCFQLIFLSFFRDLSNDHKQTFNDKKAIVLKTSNGISAFSKIVIVLSIHKIYYQQILRYQNVISNQPYISYNLKFMKQIILGVLVLLALTLTANAIHLNVNHDAAADLPAGTVLLIGDTNQYISLCHNCASNSYPDSASLSSNAQTWTLEVVGSQVAFKGSNGNYLARCNSCWRKGTTPDAAFVHTPGHQPWSLWTPELQPNGKYAFKSDTGKYLARCQGCVRDAKIPNFAFVHEPNPSRPYAQWDVVYTNLPKLGVRSLQADNGQFLKYCPSCSISNAVSVNDGNDANAKWTLVRVGLQVALKGANGNYLSRCNNCWPGGAYVDSALVHLNNFNEPYSRWTPVKQQNGKWVFQSDTGKYLARCNNCATSNTPNLAFVHSTDPNNPWAQWTLA